MEWFGKFNEFRFSNVDPEDTGYINAILHVYLRMRIPRVLLKKQIRREKQRNQFEIEFGKTMKKILKYNQKSGEPVDLSDFKVSLRQYITSFSNVDQEIPRNFMMFLLAHTYDFSGIQSWELLECNFEDGCTINNKVKKHYDFNLPMELIVEKLKSSDISDVKCNIIKLLCASINNTAETAPLEIESCLNIPHYSVGQNSVNRLTQEAPKLLAINFNYNCNPKLLWNDEASKISKICSLIPENFMLKELFGRPVWFSEESFESNFLDSEFDSEEEDSDFNYCDQTKCLLYSIIGMKDGKYLTYIHKNKWYEWGGIIKSIDGQIDEYFSSNEIIPCMVFYHVIPSPLRRFRDTTSSSIHETDLLSTFSSDRNIPFCLDTLNSSSGDINFKVSQAIPPRVENRASNYMSFFSFRKRKLSDDNDTASTMGSPILNNEKDCGCVIF